MYKTMTSIAPTSYELRIALDGIEPSIWRTLTVPADIGLDELHYVIQAVMGWTDTHLHEFRTGNQRFGDLDANPTSEGVESEAEYGLSDLLTRNGDTVTYDYDFGDGWSHTVSLISIHNEPCPTPICAGGERACPPEDCGGIPGYQHLLEVLADPQHDEHHDMLNWIEPDGFDPSLFPIDTVNELLSQGIAGIMEWLLDAEETPWDDDDADDDSDDVIQFPGTSRY